MGKKDKGKKDKHLKAVQATPADGTSTKQAKATPDDKLKAYVDKAPTDLQVRFAQWIEDKTGYKPDMKTLALSVYLRIPFQASPENQAVLQARKAENAAKGKDKGKDKDKAGAGAVEGSAETTEQPAVGKKGKKGKETTQPVVAAAEQAAVEASAAAVEDAGPEQAKPTRRRAPAKKSTAVAAKSGADKAEAAF